MGSNDFNLLDGTKLPVLRPAGDERKRDFKNERKPREQTSDDEGKSGFTFSAQRGGSRGGYNRGGDDNRRGGRDGSPSQRGGYNRDFNRDNRDNREPREFNRDNRDFNRDNNRGERDFNNRGGYNRGGRDNDRGGRDNREERGGFEKRNFNDKPDY